MCMYVKPPPGHFLGKEPLFMNSETRDLCNTWFHQCLCAIIEQADDKEHFTDLLVQAIRDIETQLIEEEGIDEEVADQHTERIVGILDEVLEDEAITDEAIENSDDDIVDIIYDAISAPPRMKPSKSARATKCN